MRRDLTNWSLDVFRDRHRIVLRAYHEVILLGITLRTRIIKIETRFVDEAVVLNIADDADDFCAADTIISAVNSFTQRVIIGPHPLGQLLTNDRHVAVIIRPERIAVSE